MSAERLEVTQFPPPGRTNAMVLDELSKIQHLPHRLFLLPEVYRVPEALELARANPEQSDVDPNNWIMLENDSKEITEYISHNYERDRQSGLMLGLYMAATGLQGLFPERYKPGVRRGAQSLVTSCTYALNAHRKNGYDTSIELPLNQKRGGLKLRMQGDEPYRVLAELYESMTLLREINDSKELASSLVVEPDDYRLYRLWSGEKMASVYVRPAGAYDYDRHIEYGRSQEGVEASISYVVDPTLQDSRLLPVGRHRGRGPDNRISIRIDREGVDPDQRGKSGVSRDPRKIDGTLSLDIGSVLGDEYGLSTKVGRLLAWGNVLRAEKLGLEPHLNHATHFFEPEDGNAHVFASAAEELVGRLEERRINRSELERRLSVPALAAA